jgi:hypothetical protein
MPIESAGTQRVASIRLPVNMIAPSPRNDLRDAVEALAELAELLSDLDAAVDSSSDDDDFEEN